MQKGITRVDSATNGLSTPKVNGVKEGLLSSGKRRSMDERPDEPSKRQRVSDDEDDEIELIKPKSPISRQPLASVNTENNYSKPLTAQRTYRKSLSAANTSQNGVRPPNTTRPPYSPKSIPPPPRNTHLPQNRTSNNRF